jgi:hypothetical protein
MICSERCFAISAQAKTSTRREAKQSVHRAILCLERTSELRRDVARHDRLPDRFMPGADVERSPKIGKENLVVYQILIKIGGPDRAIFDLLIVEHTLDLD